MKMRPIGIKPLGRISHPDKITPVEGSPSR